MKIRYKKMLRLVVGATIAKARTETDRELFYRQFLNDIARGSIYEQRTWPPLIQLPDGKVASPLTHLEEIPHNIQVDKGDVDAKLDDEKKEGFDPERVEQIKVRFARWWQEYRSRQGRNAAKAMHEKKSEKKLGGKPEVKN
jgi:hypothetical protein